MLTCEEIVEQTEPDPPIVVESGEIGARMSWIGGKHSIAADLDLSVGLGTDLHLSVAIAAVDLSGVPPVRVEIAECRGRAEPWFTRRSVGDSPANLHAAVDPFVFGPGIARLQRDLELVFRLGNPMTEPIMRFELDPGGGQQIEAGRGNEGVARQQFHRNHARAGFEQVVYAVRRAFRQREIASEPGARHAHARMVEAVERAIGGAPPLITGAPARRPRAVTSMVEVVLPQPFAEDRKIGGSEQGRQMVPSDEEVDDPKDDIQDRLEQATMEDKTIVFAGH